MEGQQRDVADERLRVYQQEITDFGIDNWSVRKKGKLLQLLENRNRPTDAAHILDADARQAFCVARRLDWFETHDGLDDRGRRQIRRRLDTSVRCLIE